MKQFVWLIVFVLISFTSCKTQKKFLVKEEAVTVVDALEGDVDYKYYIILGSFEALENAKQFSTDLQNKGFSSPVLLKSETGNYRVSVFSSDEENGARNKVASILEMYPEYEDVWLLIKK